MKCKIINSNGPAGGVIETNNLTILKDYISIKTDLDRGRKRTAVKIRNLKFSSNFIQSNYNFQIHRILRPRLSPEISGENVRSGFNPA